MGHPSWISFHGILLGAQQQYCYFKGMLRCNLADFLAVHFKHQMELFTHFFESAREKHMNNATALGGCGGALMRFFGKIVLTESSWASGESGRERVKVSKREGVSGMCSKSSF